MYSVQTVRINGDYRTIAVAVAIESSQVSSASFSSLS